MDEKKFSAQDEKSKRLRDARAYLGLTQEEMGRQCGLKGADIKNRESGRVNIKQIFAVTLEQKLGISSVWLLTGEGEMSAKKAPTKVADGGWEKYALHLEEEVRELKAEIFLLRGGGTLGPGKSGGNSVTPSPAVKKKRAEGRKTM